MSSHPTDHEAGRKKNRAVHDPHDIRSLTDTGAIRIPDQGTQRRGDRPQPSPRTAG